MESSKITPAIEPWNYHKYDEEEKAGLKKGAYFAAYIPGRECQLHKQFLQWWDWGISLSVAGAKGRETSNPPTHEKWAREAN